MTTQTESTPPSPARSVRTWVAAAALGAAALVGYQQATPRAPVALFTARAAAPVEIGDADKLAAEGTIRATLMAGADAGRLQLRPSVAHLGLIYGQLRQIGETHDAATQQIGVVAQQWGSGQPWSVTNISRVGDDDVLALVAQVERIPADDWGGTFDLGTQLGSRLQAGQALPRAQFETGAWLSRWYGGSNPWPQVVAPPPVGGRVGRLRLEPQGYTDDSGPVLPLYAHAGNLFALFTRDQARALAELDDVASAGYHGVRVWATLGGSYWDGDHVGPDRTPDYWGHVRAFGQALRVRGLRAVWSQGDVGQLRDRRAYMTQLAQVDNDLNGFIDVIDCGNEAWQTGEPDPARLAQCVGYYQAAGGQALRSLTSPPGETKDQLDEYSIDPAQIYDVHSERDQHSWDKRRHIFSIAYEGKPRRRFGINSEPPGSGRLVSASANIGELDDEAVPLLAVAGAISRQAYVWFSGEGVKIDRGLKTEAGFATTPTAFSWLPRDLMSYPTLYHSGDRFRGTRIVATTGDARVDCATNGRDHVCTIDGPGGSYRFPVEQSFAGRLCNQGDGTCQDVAYRAGQYFPVSFTRGRVLIGHIQ